MLGEGIVSFGVALGHRAEEREVVREDALLELQLPGDPHGRGRELDVTLLIVELHLQVVLRLGDAANLIDEVHVPGRAPVFAVGHGLQSDVLLHPDDGPDGGVLDAALLVGRNAAVRVIVAGPQHVWRTEQAADMIGSKWRNGMHAEMSRSNEPGLRFNHK